MSDPTLAEHPPDVAAANDPARVFGPLWGPHNVEDAVITMLQKWLWTYMAEVCRLVGREPGTLPKIRSWRVSGELENMPEDQHPAVIVRSQGLIDLPYRGGGETGHAYTSMWDVQVGVQAAARGNKKLGAPRARRLAQMYATAARGVMVQQRDPEQLIGGIDWVGSDDDVLDSTGDRTTCLSASRFAVSVFSTVEWGRGPIEPIAPPIDPDVPPDPDSPLWPEAVVAFMDLEKVPLDADLDQPGDRITSHPVRKD